MLAINDYRTCFRWQTHWGSMTCSWVSPSRRHCLQNDMLSISIEPTPTLCQLDPQEHTLAKFQSKYNHCIWNVFEIIIDKVSFMLKQLQCLTSFINSYIAPQIAMTSKGIRSMSNRCRSEGICYLGHVISSYYWMTDTYRFCALLSNDQCFGIVYLHTTHNGLVLNTYVLIILTFYLLYCFDDWWICIGVCYIISLQAELVAS